MTLSGKAKVAGVLGWPVGHSRSPRLHGYWLAQHGIDGTYVPLPVRPERFAAAVRALVDLGFAGANVTLPHKEAALAVCDTVDADARRIGAVNTMVFADGKIAGRNTDAFGFVEHLAASVPKFPIGGGPAVVLGAGGAARAVLVALADAGCKDIRVINRSVDKAEKLVDSMGVQARVGGWDGAAAALDGAALLVNTSTLGMEGQPPLELALDRLPKSAVVYHIVYVPLETALLTRARARGNPAVDGLGMLLHQGRPGFKSWFGVEPQVTRALYDFVAADLLPKKHP
ncbi:MAG: shikimate dehydrogenase [Alphaproteobacteria bacterium]